MTKFNVRYTFNGKGTVKIEAKSKKEAEDKFYEGEFEPDEENEWGHDYELTNVTKSDLEKTKEREYCFQCSPDGDYTIDDVCEVCKGINARADNESFAGYCSCTGDESIQRTKNCKHCGKLNTPLE